MKRFSALSPTTWLTAKSVFSQVFTVLLFAIQAPILGPRAFGLVSIVMVFVGFCEVVLGDAVAESLISVRQISDSHFETMNTVSLLIAAVSGIVCFLGAPAAAHLFGEPDLGPILRWMAILPAVSSLAVTPTAYVKREMQFRPLALRGIASQIVGGGVGLVLTLMGKGVWALVWQAIFTRLAATVVLWMSVPMPLKFAFSGGSLKELMQFALPTMLSRLVGWGTSQFPRFIFGLYWGATELGVFGLSARLCDILLELTLVPRYAAARVELRQFALDAPRLQQAVGELCFNMSVIAFPLCIGGAAVASTLIHAWLDARWYDAVVPASLMMLMCVPSVTFYCTGAALLAMNFQFAEAALTIAQTVVTVIAVLIFAPMGLIPATAAFAARPLLLLPVPARLLKAKCHIPSKVLFNSQWPPLLAAAVMGIGVSALRIGLQSFVRPVILLPLLVATGAVIYGLMISALRPDFVRQFLARVSVR